MRPRAVDWSLFVLVIFEFASGLYSFLVGRPEGRWVFIVHAAVGLALIPLLVWKFRRVWPRVAEPRRWQPATLVSVLASILVLFTIGSGVYWAIVQRPVDYPNGMILHTGAAIALVIFYLWHMLLRFKPPRGRDITDRRTALGWLVALGSGFFLWGAQEAANHALDTPGARRRFTGSRRAGSPAEQTDGQVDGQELGNNFPVTMWMFDNPAPVDRDRWRVRVNGLVAQPSTFAWQELMAAPQSYLRATLDCTGGWYATPTWRGVSLAWLLDQAQPDPRTRYVRFRSVTGYRWSLPLAEARRTLLATHVVGEAGDELLSHWHGAPARLVAPGRRGFQWVKWVDEITLAAEPDAGQWAVIFTSGL
jgi:DMSO/TMAO reductase YedYZ molybdopterin-dependent catalytic subunit